MDARRHKENKKEDDMLVLIYYVHLHLESIAVLLLIFDLLEFMLETDPSYTHILVILLKRISCKGTDS